MRRQEVEDSGAALNVSRIGDELQARARTRQLHLEHGADAGFWAVGEHHDAVSEQRRFIGTSCVIMSTVVARVA